MAESLTGVEHRPLSAESLPVIDQIHTTPDYGWFSIGEDVFAVERGSLSWTMKHLLAKGGVDVEGEDFRAQQERSRRLARGAGLTRGFSARTSYGLLLNHVNAVETGLKALSNPEMDVAIQGIKVAIEARRTADRSTEIAQLNEDLQVDDRTFWIRLLGARHVDEKKPDRAGKLVGFYDDGSFDKPGILISNGDETGTVPEELYAFGLYSEGAPHMRRVAIK